MVQAAAFSKILSPIPYEEYINGPGAAAAAAAAGRQQRRQQRPLVWARHTENCPAKPADWSLAVLISHVIRGLLAADNHNIGAAACEQKKRKKKRRKKKM